MNAIIQIIALIISILATMFSLSMFIPLITNRAPFVPSSKKAVKKTIDNFPLPKNAVVYDLGCGDARYLIAAEKKYAIKGKGYEISIFPFILGLINKTIQKTKTEIKLKNFFRQNISDADYIFCYLYPETMTKVAEKIKKECKKGTKLISNSFRIKNMNPKKTIKKKDFVGENVYLYEF